MSVKLINLKQYWFEEMSTSIQTQTNKWLDEITAPDSDVCLSKDFPLVMTYMQRFVDFADYLFLYLSDSKVTAFALVVDHPQPKYNIFSSFYSRQQGSLELLVLSSLHSAEAKVLFDSVCFFAQKVLYRKRLDVQLFGKNAQPNDFQKWGCQQNKKLLSYIFYNSKSNSKSNSK